MFKVTTDNPDMLKNSIGLIAEILDEGVFKVDSNGLSLLSPDRTMVAVVDFQLLSSAFNEYASDSPAELGVNMSNFVSILKRAKSSDKITLKGGDKNKLEILIEGSSKRRFELPLLDVKAEKPPVDQLSFPGKIELESNVLEEGIEDADTVSDSIVFETGVGLLRLWAKGDTSTAQLELKEGDSGLLNLGITGDNKSRYPLDYLKKMIKASKLAKNVSVEFSTDYPLRLTFKDVDKLHLGFVLAPRVSED